MMCLAGIWFCFFSCYIGVCCVSPESFAARFDGIDNAAAGKLADQIGYVSAGRTVFRHGRRCLAALQ
jgi:hypothetical protein